MKILLIALLAAPLFSQTPILKTFEPAVAGDTRSYTYPIENKVWKISMLTVIGASAFDAAASWHSREANPLLANHGQFGTRGVTIKAGLLVGLLLPQRYMIRHVDGARKPMIALNFITAAGYVAAGMIGRN